MKKIVLTFIVITLSIGLFYSCTKDEQINTLTEEIVMKHSGGPDWGVGCYDVMTGDCHECHLYCADPAGGGCLPCVVITASASIARIISTMDLVLKTSSCEQTAKFFSRPGNYSELFPLLSKCTDDLAKLQSGEYYIAEKFTMKDGKGVYTVEHVKGQSLIRLPFYVYEKKN